jgi:hypothetical protein
MADFNYVFAHRFPLVYEVQTMHLDVFAQWRVLDFWCSSRAELRVRPMVRHELPEFLGQYMQKVHRSFQPLHSAAADASKKSQ